MSEPALKGDVISALKAQKGVDVSQLNDGSIEVAAVGQPIRRFPFKATISRTMLAKIERWYGVPIAACFPPIRTKPQTNVSGE